jgi:hypothetical protein
LVGAGEIQNQLALQISSTPFRYGEMLKKLGTYRLTVQVACKEAAPVEMKVDIYWTGSWYELRSRQSR